MSDEKADRGVDVDLLAPEIEALRDAAQRYTRAVDQASGVGGAGLDLEAAAIRYVRKLDDELANARRPDYGALVEKLMRERESSDN